jgi:hypothetical protein
VRDSVAERIPTAEVTDVSLENLHTIDAPLVTKYHVHIPGYADAIGSRLGVPLNFFEAGAHALFTNEVRRYPIFFDFAEQEDDDIEIIIPEGFTLDGASAPAPAGSAVDPITARYTVKFLPKTRALGYTRHQVVGKEGNVHFVTESYPALKNLFERIHRSDGHQIVLKPKAASPAVLPPAAPATATPPAA